MMQSRRVTLPIVQKSACRRRSGLRGLRFAEGPPGGAGRVAGPAQNAGLAASDRCHGAWQSVAARLQRAPPEEVFVDERPIEIVLDEYESYCDSDGQRGGVTNLSNGKTVVVRITDRRTRLVASSTATYRSVLIASAVSTPCRRSATTMLHRLSAPP